jgi:hypothetical protein
MIVELAFPSLFVHYVHARCKPVSLFSFVTGITSIKRVMVTPEEHGVGLWLGVGF